MVSIVVIGMITNYFLLEKTKESTLNQLSAISSIQKERINEAFKNNLERLDGVTSRTQLRISLSNYFQTENNDDLNKINSILYDALYSIDDFRSISLFSVEGMEITSVSKQNEDYSIPYFPEARSSKFTTIAYEDNRPIFYLSGPLILDERLLGIITIESEASAITSITQDYTELGKTGETILAKRNADGNVIFITPLRFDPTAAFSLTIPIEEMEHPIVHAVLGKEQKFSNSKDYRGDSVLAVSKYIEIADWGLVSKIDSSEVYATFYEANIVQIGFAIILSGILASGSILFSARILRPLIKLKVAAENMEIGKFNTVLDSNGDNEVSVLVKAFEDLQDTLAKNQKVTSDIQKRLRQKLKEKNELKNALDNSSNVVITDKTGEIIYVNDKFLNLSKYSEEELIGKNLQILKSGHHPDKFFENLEKTISDGKVWKGNIKNKAKDGTFFWTNTTITPFFGEDGKPEHFIRVTTDITELMDQKELIQKQYRQLKKIDVQKEEFSSMVSHELKTPITPIKFNTEMLLEPGVLGDLTPDQLNAIKEIEINTERLENLITDILYAQRLDMDRMVFNKKEFNCRNLLARVSKNLLPLANEKHIQLKVEESCEKLFSDEARIQQMLENLVKNSIDFVPEHDGIISIGAKEYENFVTFYVKDNGIGIPKDKQHNLFKKFYQVDTSHTRKHGGTGLGLVICKGFAEGLGGRIWCESDFGKGASFYFMIPIKPEIGVETH